MQHNSTDNNVWFEYVFDFYDVLLQFNDPHYIATCCIQM